MCALNITVLGSGVVGLTTALELQKEFKNANIKIVAEQFEEGTTSFVAAGLFRPGTSFCGPTKGITSKWINDAYYFWEDLRNTTEGNKAGVTQLSGYIFSSENPGIVRNHLMENLVPIYRKATEQELNLCPGNWKYGSFLTTLLIQCSEYLPWATQQFLHSAGQIESRNIKSFGEFEDSDILVNCTGLGAKYLCNDHNLVAMRGQVTKVRAPWIKTFFYADYDTYIIPGFNHVTLGGCRQYDSYNLNVCKYDKMAIEERCYNLVPSLKGAQEICTQVGLRPHRTPVRVEKEIIQGKKKKIKVVHNYGHGGYGVTTAPGTSIYAVKLVKEMLAGNSKLMRLWTVVNKIKP